jgi:hypothetical protein
MTGIKAIGNFQIWNDGPAHLYFRQEDYAIGKSNLKVMKGYNPVHRISSGNGASGLQWLFYCSVITKFSELFVLKWRLLLNKRLKFRTISTGAYISSNVKRDRLFTRKGTCFTSIDALKKKKILISETSGLTFEKKCSCTAQKT